MPQISERLNVRVHDLSIEERILLIEEIWDSIESEQEMPDLTEEQKAELDRRLESYRKNPDESLTWESVKSRLMSG